MTKRDYWVTVAAVVGAILAHALFPRYEWRDPGGDDPTAFVRIDRWTGRSDFGYFIHIEGRPVGTWASQDDLWRALNAGFEITPAATSIRRLADEQARRRRHADGLDLSR